MGIMGGRAGVRAGRCVGHIALLSKLWPHLGSRIDTLSSTGLPGTLTSLLLVTQDPRP